jgi:hypothetical protein
MMAVNACPVRSVILFLYLAAARSTVVVGRGTASPGEQKYRLGRSELAAEFGLAALSGPAFDPAPDLELGLAAPPDVHPARAAQSASRQASTDNPRPPVRVVKGSQQFVASPR